ncbi:conserved membrane hypothetical protein [Candidatus Competibacter denitrificans Run_A_D11]|uniref:Nitrogen fixation protein FixH n=1 Tax=Candidatus Competibacter denitrificans Run_A_D11 TaxID=1400863 RepID=W6M1J7_9GAMM|nr:FixH family protein [Candidatus Competibacter denitrificans]CDI01286.1 conserved membrane hypothetical protein [Candidatus Competibacter denitrificans Run_A_D11]HRC68252.1 FixH family protein [Candidatus Competibacter denitrificans]
MSETWLGLLGGVVLILLANWLLVRFGGKSANYAATLVALVTVGLYVPYAILRWPGGDRFALHLAIFLLTSLGCGILFRANGRNEALHWGPAVISGFFVLVAVSGALFAIVAERGITPSLSRWLFPATSSGREVTSVFPGVISHDFQKKEALYNDYLQQVEAQRQRGWQVRKGWLNEPLVDVPTVFRVAVQTREGQPVTEAEAGGEFLRPSDSKRDMPFKLTETEPGLYQSTVTLPLAGRWNLVLRVRRGEDIHEVRAVTEILGR